MQIVEKLELTGIDFLWQMSLAAPEEDIAEMAIDFILDLSYKYLSPRLKKVLCRALFERSSFGVWQFVSALSLVHICGSPGLK